MTIQSNALINWYRRTDDQRKSIQVYRKKLVKNANERLRLAREVPIYEVAYAEVVARQWLTMYGVSDVVRNIPGVIAAAIEDGRFKGASEDAFARALLKRLTPAQEDEL